MAHLERLRRDASRSADGGRCVDDRALTWLATNPNGRLAPVIKATAYTADLLVPWAGLTAWWAWSGRSELRRGAVRGWLAVALAALVEGAVIKPLVGRGRPASERLPERQRQDSAPSTSAFPSGHAGAATAFAVAASHDARTWRPLLLATAIVTTYSLVYTGRHYPTDAIAGVLVGAAAGGLTGRLRLRGRAG